MSNPLCFSATPEKLLRWQEAFPLGQVVDLPMVHSRIPSGTTLVWLQADSQPEVWVGRIRFLIPDCRVVVMSSVPDQQEALAVLQAGAAGYCHVWSAPALLVQVAKAVELGGLWVGSDIMDRVLSALVPLTPTKPLPATSVLALLTNREAEVALEVGKGASNKAIARELGITERTVKAHLGLIFGKLQVRDRVQLLLLLKGVDFPR